MKNLFNIILALIGTLALSSCEKWLAVAPKSEVGSDDLFSTEQGFKDALMGSYLLLTNQSIYGFESTIGFIDILAQQYSLSSNASHPLYPIAGYQFSSSTFTGKANNIWTNSYSVIANLNNIITSIDTKQAAMNPINYALIKGEALGLRAFVHFDLYRLFGYGDLLNRPEKLNEVGLPYVSAYSKNVTPPVSGKVFLQAVEKDLLAAEKLMVEYDSVSIARYQQKGITIPNEDGFYSDRRMRFNYFAIKATQARLYLWLGDYEKAKKAAETVINQHSEYLLSFHKGNINDPKPINKDYTFSTEHIFSLNVQNMFEYIKPQISQFGPDGVNANTNKLAQIAGAVDALYQRSGLPEMAKTDYRYKELYDKINQNEYLLLKFTYVTGSTYKDRMPLIKLPEMYYILAECANETNDIPAAVEALNMVRDNRGVANEFRFPNTLTKAQVQTELVREWRKEFVSEGQLFYYYKRRAVTPIPNFTRVMDDKSYVIPIPQKELEFGN